MATISLKSPTWLQAIIFMVVWIGECSAIESGTISISHLFKKFLYHFLVLDAARTIYLSSIHKHGDLQ